MILGYDAESSVRARGRVAPLLPAVPVFVPVSDYTSVSELPLTKRLKCFSRPRLFPTTDQSHTLAQDPQEPVALGNRSHE